MLKDIKDSHKFGDGEDEDLCEDDSNVDDGSAKVAVEEGVDVSVLMTWLSFMCRSS